MSFSQPFASSELEVNPSIDMNTLTGTDWYLGDTNEYDHLDYSNMILTPPASSPVAPEVPRGSGQQNVPGLQNNMISVSSAFHPNANNDAVPTDVILLTYDSAYFYVHMHKLLAASDNFFNNLFPFLRQEAHPPGSANAAAASLALQSKKYLLNGNEMVPDPVVPLPEKSKVINIFLHAIYGKTFSQFMPSFDDLELSLAVLARYGVPLQRYVAPGSPLSNTLLDSVSTHAMRLYSLAASYNLYPLAVSVSPHLLPIPISSLSDETAAKLGGFYTKKLFLMHTGRTDALKRLLLSPPRQHPPTFVCNTEEQNKLSRAWTLAGAYLLWDAKADISLESTVSVLSNLGEKLHCEVCKMSLKMRIRTFSSEWCQVKVGRSILRL